ncbi:hypothetical protein KM043_000100, partial [Ampulex compressa]
GGEARGKIEVETRPLGVSRSRGWTSQGFDFDFDFGFGVGLGIDAAGRGGEQVPIAYYGDRRGSKDGPVMGERVSGRLPYVASAPFNPGSASSSCPSRPHPRPHPARLPPPCRQKGQGDSPKREQKEPTTGRSIGEAQEDGVGRRRGEEGVERERERETRAKAQPAKRLPERERSRRVEESKSLGVGEKDRVGRTGRGRAALIPAMETGAKGQGAGTATATAEKEQREER